jgi:chromosome segregation ATPase
MMIDPELPLALEKCFEKYFKRFKNIEIANYLISEEPDLTTSFNVCRAKNRELEEILKNQTKDINGGRIEDDGLLREVDQIEKCNRALKQSIADRDAEFEVQTKENKLLADEILEKSKTVREKDLMVESLNKAVAELEIDAKEQKKKLETLNLTLEAKQKIVEEANEKLVERESRILSLEAEKASLEKEIVERGLAQTEDMNSMKISKDDLEKKLKDEKTVNENLNRKLAQKDSEAEELTSKLQSQKALLEEQSEKLVSKENQIEELNSKLFKMDEEAEVNSSKVESVEKLLNESKEKLDEREKVIENLNLKLKKKDRQLEELDKTHQNVITEHLSQIQVIIISTCLLLEDNHD